MAKKSFKTMAMAALLSTAVCLMSAGPIEAKQPKGEWLSGDFHQHTYYTDGSSTFDFVMEQNYQYGLDWWANSEHGGERVQDGNNNKWDDPSLYPPNLIKGDPKSTGGHRLMYRWQSLRDFAYPDIVRTREMYSDKKIVSGLEWNVPGHEHCSVGVVSEVMGPTAISAFEFNFDKSDSDTSREGEWTPYGILEKQNGNRYDWSTGTKVTTPKSPAEAHQDSVAACAWVQDQYSKGLIDDAWIIFAHIERDGVWTQNSGGGYNIEHFRDFNTAAPDICFGFEGAPGHQVNHWRGFGNAVTCAGDNCTSKDFGGTYGGVGFYTAKVGGLWDSLLGEGRRWFNYANSDYHKHYTAGGDDFYPGEYQKTYVYATDSDHNGEYSLKEIAEGLRSGNAYFVQGDLINHLEFTARSRFQEVHVGGELTIKDRRWFREPLVLTIKFKSPSVNNNGDSPVVDHVDLIAGEITGLIDPLSPDYTKATNESAKVIASFRAGDWATDEDGYNVIVYHIKNVDKNMYFRLRGTNLACNTPNQTGPATALPSADYCKPLADALDTVDGAQEAWNDLWFYSNPIFVYVK
jgi:hypothetical protein